MFTIDPDQQVQQQQHLVRTGLKEIDSPIQMLKKRSFF